MSRLLLAAGLAGVIAAPAWAAGDVSQKQPDLTIESTWLQRPGYPMIHAAKVIKNQPFDACLSVKNLGHDGVNHVWRVRARDLATGQARELCLCLWDQWRGAEAIKDNEHHALFLKLVAAQGADPARTRSWTGAHVLVSDGQALAPTFAEHRALQNAMRLERCALREADPTWPPGAAHEFAARPA